MTIRLTIVIHWLVLQVNLHLIEIVNSYQNNHNVTYYS